MGNETLYLGKTIEQHRDDRTCWLCGKEVNPADGMHGATGAHWDCHQQLEVDFQTGEKRIKRLERALDRATASIKNRRGA